MSAKKVTAEDVKEIVRRYAEDNLPGWACAGVSFRVGPIPDAQSESLLVMPTRSEAASSPLPEAGGTPG